MNNFFSTMKLLQAIESLQRLFEKGICYKDGRLNNECLCFNEASEKGVMFGGKQYKTYDISPVNVMSTGLDGGSVNLCFDPFAHTLSEKLAPYGVSSAKLYMDTLGHVFVVLEMYREYILIRRDGSWSIEEKEVEQ